LQQLFAFSRSIIFWFVEEAQRLAAQALGHVLFAITILTGILKSQFSVLSLSLGQVG